MPEIRVNDAELFYVDQGAGAPVVFVHGAWMDHRYWEPQRDEVAARYRFIAYSLRYHGTAPWPDDGKHYSTVTHLADLTAFIRRLNAGPVHLVGLSMGGRLATLAALEHPDLLRSLTVLEPPLDDLLDEMPETQPVRDEWRKGFAALGATAQAGEAIRATRLFFELANNQGAGRAGYPAGNVPPDGPGKCGDSPARSLRTSAARALPCHAWRREVCNPRGGRGKLAALPFPY